MNLLAEIDQISGITEFFNRIRWEAEIALTCVPGAAFYPEQKSHQFAYLSGNFKGHREDVPQYSGEKCRDEHGMNCAVLGKSQGRESREGN